MERVWNVNWLVITRLFRILYVRDFYGVLWIHGNGPYYPIMIIQEQFRRFPNLFTSPTPPIIPSFPNSTHHSITPQFHPSFHHSPTNSILHLNPKILNWGTQRE